MLISAIVSEIISRRYSKIDHQAAIFAVSETAPKSRGQNETARDLEMAVICQSTW